MRINLPLISAMLGASLLGAQSTKTSSKSDPELSLLQRTARSNNAFGTSLYQALSTRPGNLFFSPYSISVALAMTRAGARGTTADQMDRVLHTKGMDAAKGHQALRAGLRPRQISQGYGRERHKVPAFVIDVANRIWVQQGLKLETPFVTTQKSLYGAQLARVDFTKSAAVRKEINDWVAEQTHKRILDIVPDDLPTPDTLLALANAIYFKASWANPFSEAATKDAPFTTLSGKIKDVAMMRKTDMLRYGETELAQIVEISYLGSECVFSLVLPKAKDGLEKLEKQLSVETLDSWIHQLKPRRVALQMPKFKSTSSFRLGETLIGMGMKAPFSAMEANFKGITQEVPLFIGPVLHKAFIALDEKGTEAAAATIVMMKLGSAARPQEPVAVVADHPFIFAIRHKKTGCVLFLGRIADPSL